MQNTAARILTRTSKYASISAILKDLHWLPVRQRITFKILTITWKVLHGQAPSYIRELLHPYVPSRELRSTNQSQLTVPKYYHAYGKRAYAVAAPILWNSLPNAIKVQECYITFKKHLKTHLFKEAYNL